ncbi:MAG TPA: hypothetical protein VF215_03820 [Thermoanaerobaculia bacterium]
MNEIDRDYLAAKEFVTAFADEAVRLFLLVVVIFIVLWFIGVYLMFWPITVPLTIVGLVWLCASTSVPAATPDPSMPTHVPNVRGEECVVITPAGAFVAPNLETLLLWVREQRVPPQSYVFTCDLGAWRVASQIEELALAFRTGA